MIGCSKNLRLTALAAAFLAVTAVNGRADFITAYGLYRRRPLLTAQAALLLQV